MKNILISEDTSNKLNRNIFTLNKSLKYVLHADRSILCALILLPSQLKVTSTSSSSDLNISKAHVMCFR